MTNGELGEKKQSITSDSSRDWIDRRIIRLKRYLRRNHKTIDIPRVFRLIYYAYPDEGRKLVENEGIDAETKIALLIKWIVHQPQITCLILGDQRMGKDALICRIFELIVLYCKANNMLVPRFVTLGNVKKPPFVADEDMYFSFRDIPFGTAKRPVYIYSSELESEFPARDFQSSENKLFSILEGTLAQNHQKLFGCVKLASKVDISILRSCNVKLFKYISPEKLEIEGVERVNFLSDLGKWFLPKDVRNKSDCLFVFDNNLLTVKLGLPSFWDDEYSEQFRGDTIDINKIYDFIKARFDDTSKLTAAQINNLQIGVYQKFRRRVSKKEIEACFNFDGKSL